MQCDRDFSCRWRFLINSTIYSLLALHIYELLNDIKFKFFFCIDILFRSLNVDWLSSCGKKCLGVSQSFRHRNMLECKILFYQNMLEYMIIGGSNCLYCLIPSNNQSFFCQNYDYIHIFLVYTQAHTIYIVKIDRLLLP